MNRDRPVGGAGFALAASVWAAVAGIGLVFAMIAVFAVPVFFSARSGDVFSWRWQPSAGRFGIAPMLAGSALTALSAVVLSWPLALGFASLELTTRSERLRRWLGRLLRLLASIPTVVYGFASVFLLVPLIRRSAGGSGLGWLTAVPVLALLIFPTLAVVMRAALGDRLTALWPGAAALGLTRVQAVVHFVIPSARRGLAAAAGLGFARAIGDTMISLMLAGNAPHIPARPTDSLRTLTAHMALVSANEVGGAAYDSLFAAGALVLLLGCGVGMAARLLAGRAER